MTVLEYLCKLPLKYRKQAISNYNNNTNKLTDAYPNSKHDAILLAFNWNKSIEGKEYWLDVYTELKDGLPKVIKPVKQAERIINSVYIKKPKPVRVINSTYIKSLSNYNTYIQKEDRIVISSNYGRVYDSLDDALCDVFKNKLNYGKP